LDVNKYRALFIEESREHLATTSRLLVALEKAAPTEAPPLVDEVFRHVHSLKGMAASMGYEPISNLAHRLEDLVGGFQGSAVEQGVIDLLLRGVDALSEQVESIAAERHLQEHNELLRALRALATGEEAAPSPSPEAAPPTTQPAIPAAPPTPGGRPSTGSVAKEILVRLDESTAAPQVRAFLVYRHLEKTVEIASADPSLEAIKAGQLPGFELRFRVTQPFDETECVRRLESLPDVEQVEIRSPQAPVAPAAEEAPRAEPTAASSTVRVRTDILDQLIDSVGELFIVRERLRSLLGEQARPEVGAALDSLATRIREIHDQVMAVRIVPLRTVTDRYPRLVRDLSRALGKDVTFSVEGGDIELDRAVLEHLEDPFVHSLRNAIDHGLEAPAERLERGKPAAGQVHIAATRDRDSVLVSVEDDGRGLDPELLRRKAIDRGLLHPDQAEGLGARESFFLICLPGFSTKAEVSDVSGRGVGMDAVRTGVESMGGGIDIESELGRGTRIIFRLPLTLAIIPVLLVEVAGRVFAVPAAKVVAIREPGNDIFEQAGGNIYLSFLHALVLIAPLAEVLRLKRRARFQNVVVLEDGRDLYAVGVDRILGYQEVVVKPLGAPLELLPMFAGATVLGDGRPILILDLPKALRTRVAA
jgi:two-component system chemotaxis sensor kinase CheA